VRLITATDENRQTLEAAEKQNYVKPPRQGKAGPLIPLGTELRILKTQQEWINERTAAIVREGAGGRSPEQAEELRRLVRRQAKVHEMTKDVIRNLAEWQP
jgi:hypothetical protein